MKLSFNLSLKMPAMESTIPASGRTFSVHQAAASGFLFKDPGSAITHLIGMLAALFAAPPLLMKAAQNPDRICLISMAIFIGTMILLYAASTTYHSLDLSP